jgi:hypothetical protein
MSCYAGNHYNQTIFKRFLGGLEWIEPAAGLGLA